LLDYLHSSVWSWNNNDEIAIDYKLNIKDLRYGWTANYQKPNGSLGVVFVITSAGSSSEFNLGDTLEMEFSKDLKYIITRKLRNNVITGVVNSRLLEKSLPFTKETLKNTGESNSIPSSEANPMVSQLISMSPEVRSRIFTLPPEWEKSMRENPQYYKNHNQWGDIDGHPISPGSDSLYFEARGVTFPPPSNINPGGSMISRGNKHTEDLYSRNTQENNFKIIDLIKLATKGDALPVAPLPESAPVTKMTSSASLPNIPIFTEASANQIEARFCEWMPAYRFLPLFHREQNLGLFSVIVEGRWNNAERQWELRAVFEKLPVPTLDYEVQWFQNFRKCEDSNKLLVNRGYEILSQQIFKDPNGDIYQTVWVRKEQLAAARNCLQR
jgi:hypothetical protein